MNVKKFTPSAPFILTKITKEVREDRVIIVEENTDDFVLIGEVVKTFPGSEIKEGDHVVFHVLNAESLRDGSDDYYLLDVKHIRGFYGE